MASSAPTVSWQEGKTLVECQRHLFTHKPATDVTFDVRYQHPSDTSRPNRELVSAHKTVLLSRSPVFYAMFCGELAEVGGSVVVDDVDPEAFNEMLRFIYTDEVNLTANNVLFILYASKKYLVTLLTSKCLEFRESQLDATNALDILEQCMFFREDDLGLKALQIIQEHTSEAFKSEGLKKLSSAGLKLLLDCTTLNCSELDVFLACMKWAAAECKRQKLVNNRENLRLVLGDMFYKIRFPTMSLEEFNTKVVPTGIVTNEEGFQLYQILTQPNNLKPNDSPFLTIPRGVVSNILLSNCSNLTNTPIYCLGQPFIVTVSVSESLRLKSLYIFDTYNPFVNLSCCVSYRVVERSQNHFEAMSSNMIHLSTQQIGESTTIGDTKCQEIDCKGICIDKQYKYEFHITVGQPANHAFSFGNAFGIQRNGQSFSKGKVVYNNKQLSIKTTSNKPIIVYGFKCRKIKTLCLNN